MKCDLSTLSMRYALIGFHTQARDIDGPECRHLVRPVTLCQTSREAFTPYGPRPNDIREARISQEQKGKSAIYVYINEYQVMLLLTIMLHNRRPRQYLVTGR